MLETHFNCIGGLFIALSLVHVIFPRYFNWASELRLLSLINREIMVIHTFFIALVVFLMGVLCLSSANELVCTALGKRLCLGLAIFWSARLIIQFFGYSSLLWKGKRFETFIHLLFATTWAYVSLVFWWAYFM